MVDYIPDYTKKFHRHYECIVCEFLLNVWKKRLNHEIGRPKDLSLRARTFALKLKNRGMVTYVYLSDHINVEAFDPYAARAVRSIKVVARFSQHPEGNITVAIKRIGHAVSSNIIAFKANTSLASGDLL